MNAALQLIFDCLGICLAACAGWYLVRARVEAEGRERDQDLATVSDYSPQPTAAEACTELGADQRSPT